jgi:hypothetical protein
MRMIDFPFGDCCGKRCYGRDGCIEGHMNLAKGKCLIERAWVFKVKWGVGDEVVMGEAFTVVEKDQRGREKKKELAKVTEGKVLEFNAEGAAKIAFREPVSEELWVPKDPFCRLFPLEGCDCDTRLILHGLSFLEWSKRSEVGVKNRADALTSVNWRLARRRSKMQATVPKGKKGGEVMQVRHEPSGEVLEVLIPEGLLAEQSFQFDLPEGSGWEQAGAGYECLPLKKDIPWRKYLNRNQAQVTWKWREWKGDKQGFPPADLPVPGRDPDVALRLNTAAFKPC